MIPVWSGLNAAPAFLQKVGKLKTIETMANRCDTTYRITGAKESVMNLWNTLESMEVNGKDVWLDRLAEHYGIDYRKKGISVRGHIYSASCEVDEKTGFTILTIDTDTAWTGCHELFSAISRTMKGTLSISYKEIEPGCDIYFEHDEGDFFPEECCVSSYGEPFEAVYADDYATVTDAINYWCCKMDFERGDKTDEEMLDLIGDYTYESEDTYFQIHPFIQE